MKGHAVAQRESAKSRDGKPYQLCGPNAIGSTGERPEGVNTGHRPGIVGIRTPPLMLKATRMMKQICKICAPSGLPLLIICIAQIIKLSMPMCIASMYMLTREAGDERDLISWILTQVQA